MFLFLIFLLTPSPRYLVTKDSGEKNLLQLCPQHLLTTCRHSTGLIPWGRGVQRLRLDKNDYNTILP